MGKEKGRSHHEDLRHQLRYFDHRAVSATIKNTEVVEYSSTGFENITEQEKMGFLYVASSPYVKFLNAGEFSALHMA